MRNRIIYILARIILRLADRETVERIARDWLRGTGHAVLNPGTVEVTLAAVDYQRKRLRKLGGGNVSKLRDPRKSLIRVARNFERVVEEASRG